MSSNWYQDIKDLMKLYGQEVKTKPEIPDEKIVKLRVDLIYEEVIKELLYNMGYWQIIESLPPNKDEDEQGIILHKTYRKPNLSEIADGIVDSIVVLLGAACAFGIDIQPLWDIVHQSNLEKANGPVREDGKRLKPEGWKPPDILGELRKQGWSGQEDDNN